MKKTAVFPGSFSPFTLGHKAVVEGALPLFDQIVIAIGNNPDKTPLFSVEKRLHWISKVFANQPKISVEQYSGLTVNFCQKHHANYILRGLRNSDDFRWEKNIAQMNKELNPAIETIFIITPAKFSHISSSLLRDIMKNGGDISPFIPEEITL